MKMKNIAAVAMAGCMAASLAACGGSASSAATDASSAASTEAATSEATEATGTSANGFTVQLGPNPETLDPALNSAIDGANTLITVFEPLLLIDENNEVVPGQADLPEVSEDGLTWTFTMKDGLKWSDGSDLTAKDFEYSFKRLACPDTAAPYGETVVGMIDGLSLIHIYMGPYTFLASRSWLACAFLLGLMAVLRKMGKTCLLYTSP